MNSLARKTASSELAFSRASAHVSSAGRSPAYRRLASQLSQNASNNGARQQSSMLSGSVRSPLRSSFVPAELRCSPTYTAQSRLFHLSSRLHQEKPQTEQKPSTAAPTDAKEKKPAEADAESEAKPEEEQSKKTEDGESVFMETMNTEFQKSQEWNESTKQIAASANQFAESEGVRRAREAYEKSTGAVSSTLGKGAKVTAGAIGKGASWTWDTSVVKGVRKAANVTGDAVDKATQPIRNTEAYKNVKNVIDDGSSSRYGGWVEKEERRKRREALDKQRGYKAAAPMEEDINAGTSVTVHKDAAWKEAWRDFRDQNKYVQGLFSLRGKYEESENPLVSTARSITDRIGGFFAENETAMVIKKFRSMDPNFQTEPFLQELREYILPEVLDAYVKGDAETLKLWLSAAQYSVYEALTKQYLQAGMKSDGKILDIRNVDILRARMLDPGEVPVFIITCRTQEVHVYRNAKTNELAAGMEDKVQLVTYAIGITRVPEDVNNPETRGWRLIEMQKSGRDWY
ncbi:Tim44-like domain [Fusarium oxysporum f. sp. vasinfectum]|nr:Tim44-like domain [Fusarium oxysporum f. sp. vasinfectum]WKT44417.1 Tim44-like domain [Fusarium oxysporum f. sp. vasinfectum]